MGSRAQLGRAAAAVTAAVLSLGVSGPVLARPAPIAHPPKTQVGSPFPTRATGPGLYLVTLAQAPAAAYDGGVTGYPATTPRDGARFDRTRPAVASYRKHLVAGQDRILDSVGNPPVLYRYTTALDGFAADLTPTQVKRLRATPGVVLVEKSTRQHTEATAGPAELAGATLGFADQDAPDHAGKGVVIGFVDSGIWPENPSFSGLPQRKPGLSPMAPGFHGACQAGEDWTATDCNTKVISARYFVKGFGAGNVAEAEFTSPRDGSGHGSHTASVAAGDGGVPMSIDGQAFGRGSGVAPGARIAVYKACWIAPNPAGDGCTTADTVAAIDHAVADGVDVLDYPIAGPQEPRTDSVELAFLNAAAAGVFVSTAAGNEGPEAGSVSHPSPWVTTVGASVHRLFQGAVVLGNGAEYVGAMVADHAVPTTRIVLSSDVPAPGATTEDARLCQIGSLAAQQVEGKVVVCDRGVIARVDKSTAVARAGGAGMVLANVEPDSIDADVHAVPTVHVDVTAAQAIKNYVRTNGDTATAALDPDAANPIPLPQLAGFSSRGPALAEHGDVLKPDLAAPGVNVVSAAAPPSDSGRLWDLSSGTSMSASQVAGLAAVVAGDRPDWTPAQIKSAMMTTARDVEGTSGPFSQGAGYVDPQRVLDPGLVFDAGLSDWRGFLAGQGIRFDRDAGPEPDPLRATDLNLPSIAVGDLVGDATVRRTVTNLSAHPESYDASVTGLDGLDVTVHPSTIALAPGESATFTVSFASLWNAPIDSWAKGYLTWTGLTHQVRIPVAVAPHLVSVPASVTGTGGSGSVTVPGRSGTDTPVHVTSTGLVPASPTDLTLVPGRFDPAAPSVHGDTFSTRLDVPTGTEVARVQVSASSPGDDLDLYLYHDGVLVAQASSASAEETITLSRPEPGGYTVYVSAASADNGVTADARLYSWVLGADGGSPLTVSPDTVTAGGGSPFDLSASWQGLDPSMRWLARIGFEGASRSTLLEVR